MKKLRSLVSILLVHQGFTWTPSLATGLDATHTHLEVIQTSNARRFLQTTPQPSVCPETEYYCGAEDAFEKEVHDALKQPNGCTFDTGTLQYAGLNLEKSGIQDFP